MIYRNVRVSRRTNINGAVSLSDMSLQVSSMTISSNCCNDLIELDLNQFKWLRSIEIGHNCFGSVKSFRIDGLNRLKTLTIGNNSFTQINSVMWDEEMQDDIPLEEAKQLKSFHILNCESLESIQIGRCSFSDFGVDFELKNLTQLQILLIGKIGIELSCNFFWISFEIRGNEMK